MHRAEQIMQAVAAAVTGLAATGSNVERGRVIPFETAPGISVSMADDDTQSVMSGLVDSALELELTAHAKVIDSLPETELNQIRAEVYAALMADRTQGLPFVIDTIPLGADKPEISGEADQPTGQLVTRWQVKYRHSLSSAEA